MFLCTGLRIIEIGLVMDEKLNHTLEAFVLFSNSDDFDRALKRNWEMLGNRWVIFYCWKQNQQENCKIIGFISFPNKKSHVKIFRSSEKQMKLRAKIPEKQKKANVEEKITHVQQHVQNTGALISLPVEKVAEKKVTEKKVAEKKATEKKATEKKVAEKKVSKGESYGEENARNVKKLLSIHCNVNA